MLPFRSEMRGVAPVPTSRISLPIHFINVADYKDIVEEALELFRGNVYFANFEIKGPADRLLVVLILYISRVHFCEYIYSCTSV